MSHFSQPTQPSPSVTPQPGTLPAVRPTHVRYQVVALAVLLGMVTYLDRVCISKLAPDIMRDLQLDKVQMGYVFSAFALAYAVFALPAARWAERVGTRFLLAAIVVWWSAFTIGTACAWGFAALLVIRFLFGAGEAGAWPCIAQTFSRWIPRRERGTIQGIFFTGAHLSGGATPLLVVWLSAFMSWRSIFVLFGLVGGVWAAVWYGWFRNTPAEHRRVNPSELTLITAEQEKATAAPGVRLVSWQALLKSPNVQALCLMYFPNSFVFYFCITWLPTYLKEKHHFDASTLGLLAGLPLTLSVLGDLLGGVVTDRVTARFGLRAGRCLVGAAAYLMAGLGLLAAPLCSSSVLAAVLIALAVAAVMFTLGAAWGTCIDIGGRSAGVVSAAMNTAGQVGSLLCPLMVAYTLKWFHNDWNIVLYFMGASFLVGTVCWFLIDPRKPVIANPPAHPVQTAST
jgi:MFS transporter, ACS family, glucarate transporter